MFERWKEGGCLETLPLEEKHGGVCPGPSAGPPVLQAGHGRRQPVGPPRKLFLHPTPGQGPRKGRTNKRTNHPPITNGGTTFPFQQTKWEVEVANPTQSTLLTRSSHPVTHQWSVRQLDRQADRHRPPGRTRGAATALLANGQCCSFSLGPRMPPRKEHLQGGAKSWASSPPQQQWDILRRQSEQS